jgi:nitrous oxidase accessory protein
MGIMENRSFRKNLAVAVVALFLGVSVIPSVIGDNPGFVKTIYVDDDGGADYTRIQDAIDNASDGDTVYVYSGEYIENIKVNKRLSLFGIPYDEEDGNDEGKPFIKSNSGTSFEVQADFCKIDGFKVKNDNRYQSCFRIWNKRCNISNNEGLGGCHYGIFIGPSAQYTKIYNNVIDGQTIGIRSDFANNIEIIKNNITNTLYAIGLGGAPIEQGFYHKVMYNNIFLNRYGIDINTCHDSEISYNHIYDNKHFAIAFGTFSYGYKNARNKIENNIISGNSKGIRSSYCYDNLVKNNYIYNNTGDGITIKSFTCHSIYENNHIYSNGGGISILGGLSGLDDAPFSNSILNNYIIENNHIGIEISFSNFNSVIGNNIISNNHFGLSVESSKKNKFESNNVVNNSEYGFLIKNSNSNEIKGNNFFNNRGEQAYLIGPIHNQWRGNYWGENNNIIKIIDGYFLSNFYWFNIDWFPAKEPYDIPIPEVPT